MNERQKSLPTYQKFKGTIEEVEGIHIIKGVVIIQSGIDKVGDLINEQFIKDIVEQGNAQGDAGIKSRFGHPAMCNDALGTYIGRFKNFSSITDDDGLLKAVADLHLDPVCKQSPQGDLYTYVLSMASSNADMFGNSIVFRATSKEVKMEDEKGEAIWVYELTLVKFLESDLVDSPAATTNLFKSSQDMGVRLTMFFDQNPDIFKAITEQPETVTRFFDTFIDRYTSYIQFSAQTMTTEEKKKQKEKVGLLNKTIAKIRNMFSKSIDLPLADGRILVVDTNAEEPAVGDAVMIDGTAAPDGDYPLADGRTIKVADGKISEIVAAEEQGGDAAAEEQKQVDKLRAQIKEKDNRIKSLDAKVKAFEKRQIEIDVHLKSIEELLPEITSDGEPTEDEDGKKKKNPSETKKGREAMMDRIKKKDGLPDEDED
jgi:hypothetical protein